jgi:hypothetical protein
LNHENFFNSVKSLRYPHRARSLPATLAFVKHKTKQKYTWWKVVCYEQVIWYLFIGMWTFIKNKRNQFPLNRKTSHFIFPLIWNSINMLIASTMNQLAHVNFNYIKKRNFHAYLFIYQFTIHILYIYFKNKYAQFYTYYYLYYLYSLY